ncbi:nucleotide-binding universal stress UspA family protein [Streptomyces sp. SAI-208]|uniref:universal stress protein n=1 Tax=unclassified Streptomyces TaxID=2593676 RepID=UPI0024747E7C|nr:MULTISPECIES: universal stress protein [unclassified Streptomyces]MDH6520617.1 nucleotide-binding universal stress UspA family protein [Streptomyces sp. SAI-090]MDH6583120.1 nucleotide-binding universal stress UspA family protein [Streptomyces sp. SAI-133]MDH6611602.1 nucleotide-binding universal stress UspA family protein [Streptomyces sp. SAI-208]MDH6615292.1 nucleotide-binding universal stress UspA family protein [Streptomyces sp. SAI-135]
MSMDLPVVVGVDGSEPALRALDWACDEAALRGAPLRIVNACLWERYEGAALAHDLGEPSSRVLPQDVVQSAVRRAGARHPDLKVTSEVVFEEPEYALVRESREASLLVTGTRGRGGVSEALLGSVSLAVAGHAHCPVVVVRGSHDNQARSGRHGRVVVGVGGGSEGHGRSALDFALAEAARRGVQLEAIRAWRCPAHESTDHPLLAGEPARLHEQQAVDVLEAALRDAPADADLRRRTVEGPAGTVLAGASHHADLLVIGARRHARHFGLQLGRVAHRVLHHSDCPVAIVPEQE